MAFLIANADNTVSLSPRINGVLTQPESFSVAVKNGAGEPLTLSNEPQWVTDGLSLKLNDTEITTEDVGTRFIVEWKYVIAGETCVAKTKYHIVDRPQNGLVSIGDAKDYIGTLVDDSSDDVIYTLIKAASRAILGLPGTPSITLGTVEGTRYLYLFNDKVIYVDECAKVTEVYDANRSPIQGWTAVPGNNGFIRWIELPSRYEGSVSVDGTFGYDEIPEDLAQACRITVKAWFERDKTTFVAGVDMQTGFFERPHALPSAALGLVEPYRKRKRM
jgi:hypothetical protein